MNTLDTTPLADDRNPARLLILDNYDSFTYNIRELLAKIGVDAIVKRNDEITIGDVQTMDPSHIIISPGPGTPDNPKDIGITNEVIAYAIAQQKALLGICLGHQAIAKYFGGNIVQAPEIVHGKTSSIEVEHPSVLFEGIQEDEDKDGVSVMRYHSLVVDEKSFPEALRVTARTRDKYRTIMAFECNGKSVFGVQFHPESFATKDGRRIFENFLNVRPDEYARLLHHGVLEECRDIDVTLPDQVRDCIDSVDQTPFTRVEFPCELSPEEVCERLHASSENFYCLESINTEDGESSRNSTYFGIEPRFVISACNDQLFVDDVPVEDCDVPFEVLDAAMKRMHKRAQGDAQKGQSLTGGFVGYMSYEAFQYLEPTAIPPEGRTPEGQKTFSYGYHEDGLMYDSNAGKYYYYTRGADRSDLFRKALNKDYKEDTPVIEHVSDEKPRVDFIRDVGDIRDEKIRTGETFQTVLSRPEKYSIYGSMAPIYKKLRKVCPSGYMHFMKMGKVESLGSFPELALCVENGVVHASHLAGTCERTGYQSVDAERFKKLIADPKELAEHEMLVDLARNDISRCCVPGTVEIPEGRLEYQLNAGSIMHIASEVRGRINGFSPLRALLTVVPMGTVSGAPKVRSAQIIYDNERRPRGLYAGSFGFVDITGNAEAVVGLRSVMRSGNELTIQAGAGIVYDSDPEKEYEETEKKMRVATACINFFVKKKK